MIVLIPSYEPNAKLIELVASIRANCSDQIIVIVDDGSGPAFADTYAAAQANDCDVIRHSTNRGKGFALKAGFAHITATYPGHDVVCADSDGQHTAAAIARVAQTLETETGIVLGSRQFDQDVPIRSRVGNTATRIIFRLLTGLRLRDTQTGLRGYRANLLGWLQTISGDRFEYELEVLLTAQQVGHRLYEVPIETIYLQGNTSSHFRPVRDSIRIYTRFLRFTLSSFGAFLIDATIFFTLMAIADNLALAVVVARMVSATANYFTNHQLVFTGHETRQRVAARRYGALVLVLLAVNYLLIWTTTTQLSVPLAPAKVLVEVGLFLASYRAQQRFVFATSATGPNGN